MNNSRKVYAEAFGVCYKASNGMFNLLAQLEDNHGGEDAIIDLAGAIQYYERTGNHRTAHETLMHDLSISDEPDATPRSAGFGRYFKIDDDEERKAYMIIS